MCEAEAGYARQYLARHRKSWQVPGMHIAAVKGSRGARSDRLYVSRYLLCRCFLVRHMTNSLRWFALAVASAAAAAQAEQVPSWAIDLQQRVSLLEKEKADLQHVVADLRQELTMVRVEAKRQGPQSARVAVSSQGKSSIRQLTETPESCCR